MRKLYLEFWVSSFDSRREIILAAAMLPIRSVSSFASSESSPALRSSFEMRENSKHEGDVGIMGYLWRLHINTVSRRDLTFFASLAG